MLIYFNRQPVPGPWGGGSKVLTAIVNACQEAGHRCIFTPVTNIDVSFCMDPRPGQGGSFEDLRRLGAPIIQRIGDIGTHGKPELTELLRKTAPHAHRVVYPSAWAMHALGVPGTIIRNAPISEFYQHRTSRMKVSTPIRVVTHHWSNNPRKGFAFYADFIRQCGPNISFTFIGRSDGSVPSSGVMDANQLSMELPKYDIYMTASEAEAGANHVLEGMAAGLPVVYHEHGGSICEYSIGMGMSSPQEAVECITSIASAYGVHREAVLTYGDTMAGQAVKYVKLFEEFR